MSQSPGPLAWLRSWLEKQETALVDTHRPVHVVGWSLESSIEQWVVNPGALLDIKRAELEKHG